MRIVGWTKYVTKEIAYKNKSEAFSYPSILIFQGIG